MQKLKYKFRANCKSLNDYARNSLQKEFKMQNRLLTAFIGCFLFLTSFSVLNAQDSETRYGTGYREETDGWIFVHIQGPPRRRGIQYGYLLAPEIDDFIKVLKVYLKENTGKEWDFFRNAAESFLNNKLGREYKREINGIVAGLEKRGYAYDLTDIVVQNAFFELADYYLPSVSSDAEKKTWGRRIVPAMRCSAFIATGDWTKDGKIVMGHNSWDDYIIGQRFNVILDIKPTHGQRLMIQCAPGLIHSGTDFVVNSAGIVITETTIGNFSGYDTEGIPEFIRARKAAQYSRSLDDYVKIMSDGNNGGYANTWLIGDIKTNEIGRLELGLHNVTFSRSKNGFYDGENYVDDSKMIREECGPTLWKTESDWPNKLSSVNCVTARRLRWYALMSEYKGKIDIDSAKLFEADQYEQALGKINPGGFVLMARMEITDIPEIPGAAAPRPFGANEAKVITADLAKNMQFWARMGHPDGTSYQWDTFLEENPEYNWQKPYLKNLETNSWSLFSGTAKRKSENGL